MNLTLTSRDGHRFRAYSCGSPQAKLGLIVVQEIFGVNAHIRGVCDRWASEGYQVISPALFDRVKQGLPPADGERPYGVELGYTPEDIKQGARLAKEVGYFESPLLEIEACLAQFPAGMPVGLVGYCWGGTLAWLSACRLHPSEKTSPGGRLKACVGYYGGMIAKLLDAPPDVPIMLHFGQKDNHISMADVEAIKAAYPKVPVHTYPAGHGFNCDSRVDYDAAAAASARERSIEFFKSHLK